MTSGVSLTPGFGQVCV